MGFRNVYKILVEKPTRRGFPEDLEVYRKIILKWILQKFRKSVYFIQDRVEWVSLVNRVMRISFLYEAVNFLIG